MFFLLAHIIYFSFRLSIEKEQVMNVMVLSTDHSLLSHLKKAVCECLLIKYSTLVLSTDRKMNIVR